MVKHKRRHMTSYETIHPGNDQITLMEHYPCNDKHELLARERYWIDHTPN